MKHLTEKFIYLDTHDWQPEGEAVKILIDAASTMTSSKKGGTKSSMEAHLKLREEIPLQYVLGIPASQVTREYQYFAETAYRYAFGKPAKWTDQPGWQPVNPRKSSQADLKDSILDYHFIESLGLPKSARGRIFMSESVVDRCSSATASEGDLMRCYFALRLFGFIAPEHFFRDKIQK